MAAVPSDLDRTEFRRRGNHLYEEQVLPQTAPSDYGRYVAIDVDGGGHEIADDSIDAVMRLRARVPGARCWMRRIGHETSGRIGASPERIDA